MMPGNSVSPACSLRTRLSRISCLTGRERRPDCRSSPRVLKGTMGRFYPAGTLFREIRLGEFRVDRDLVEPDLVEHAFGARGDDDMRGELVAAGRPALEDGHRHGLRAVAMDDAHGHPRFRVHDHARAEPAAVGR